ncbi:family 43 glycosylhydrolase [Paenibacillus paridis]|uniref:glycoside hydrolase family 43 protein n=1 Tax=Paenibacillus paridis TaxID=2583376 RepID=UPI00111E49E3|nr:family 43 glycosylhydrolase [Paenibacillus paridis]
MSIQASERSSRRLRNPLVEQRADPWVYKHTDGFYYFTGSVPEYDRIVLRRAESLEGLTEASEVVAWKKYEEGAMSKHIWAPELHFINGKWYIYFAAARQDEPFRHRMYVLENESSNPLEGSWTEKGQIVTGWDSFSLDATSFEQSGEQYLVWAQQDPAIPGNTSLYIATMSNPWTLKSKQVLITKPELDWEMIGFMVNEGAAVLKRNGRIFLTYSGSATDHNYAMGLLSADQSSDLLDPASWVKSQNPVFESCPETSQYGPGHNSFTVTEDGEQDVLIYHARSYKEIVGDPLFDPNRHARAKVFTWNVDGTPNLGKPPADTV